MNQPVQTIKINAITIPPRLRKEVNNINSLAESIRELGLLQPIGLTEDKVLIYGFRRLSAHLHLGLDEIRYITAKEVPEDERLEMEFAENHEREGFTWWEEALSILRIYREKKKRGAIEGWSWGQRQAADLFKMSTGNVNLILAVAQRLESELTIPEAQRKYFRFSSCNEAYRLGILGEEEELANRILAEKARANVNEGVDLTVESNNITSPFISLSDLQLDEQKKKYLSNPLNKPEDFETYITERQQTRSAIENTCYLSNKIIHDDCIHFMNLSENIGRFDHIITDPPYAIDMNMLKEMNDIEKVEAEHEVEPNKELLKKFFPAAFKCTKEQAFVITCCDISVWQLMYDASTQAGFRVQRWPYIWRKVNQSVSNGAAHCNFTKDFELVMISRKENTSLASKRGTSFTDAGNGEVTRLLSHPFSKPFELSRDLIEAVSLPNQTILDPFAGGGSIVLQALRMGRFITAVEMNDNHYNNLLENLKREYYLKLNPNFTFK